MSRPIERSYSFESHEELSLDPNGRSRYEPYPTPYRDQPSGFSRDSKPTSYTAYKPTEKPYDPPAPPVHQAQPNYDADHDNPFATPSHERQDPQDLEYTTSMRTASTTTPGMDNLGLAAAGGGISGIAFGVANTNQRDSGVQALRSYDHHTLAQYGLSKNEVFSPVGTDTPYIPDPPYDSQPFQHENPPYSLMRGPATIAPFLGNHNPNPFESPSTIRLNTHPSDTVQRAHPSSTSLDNPYKRYSSAWDSRVGQSDIHPDEIEDDGDDGITVSKRLQKRPIGAGAADGGVLGGFGGILTPSGNYRAVGQRGQIGDGSNEEKSEWLASQTSGRRKWTWIVGIIVALVVIGAIIGGIIGGIKASQKNSSSNSQGESAAQDDGAGDLDANSAEIVALLGNPNLHRVFPGIDYTPFNAQYPACLTNPPSQNNVTRDMAVLSQLTNTVRLYGTDCNQTEMVLHSINKLALTDMKLWPAVWLDNNATTNARGMAAMYDLVDKYGATPFAGIIIGNEVLYRKDLTAAQLGDVVTGVRSNLTTKNIDLPIAIADLGDEWTAALTATVDVVMSNVHPFFAGVTAEEAAGWTWEFWQTHDVLLTQGTTKRNIISETGWPSTGGNDCGAATCTSHTQGSIAGIDEMNTFMDTFVCQSLANGTEYFWWALCKLMTFSAYTLTTGSGSKPLMSRGRWFTTLQVSNGRTNGG